MTLETATRRHIVKPWGTADLEPWSSFRPGDLPIGEILFERSDAAALPPALLLKLLLTTETLSIQVHPDDRLAQSMGMPRGKTEAWYVLSAEPGAKVGIGLTQRLDRAELRKAILDGSISGLLRWHPAKAGDVFHVAAGTIHAIGEGLVIAEIQQRSDATFRLFDYGRGRELHVDQSVAATEATDAGPTSAISRLDSHRTQLATCAFFTLDLVDVAAHETLTVETRKETWLLVVAGSAHLGKEPAGTGDAFFAETETFALTAHDTGARILVAFQGDRPKLIHIANDVTGTPSHLTPVPAQAPSAPPPNFGGKMGQRQRSPL